MHEKFAGAERIGVELAGLFIGADMTIVEKQLASLERRVAIP
jgi:hypothetical protein